MRTGHGGHGDAAKKDGHTGYGPRCGRRPRRQAAGKGVGGPKVDFEAHFKQPGTYKAWGTIQRRHRRRSGCSTVPFTFTVEKGP
jgi:hypothetical protein